MQNQQELHLLAAQLNQSIWRSNYFLLAAALVAGFGAFFYRHIQRLKQLAVF
jgi:hypothetical protein